MKLMRLDAEILELRYLHERELMRESELNKHTLLASRGFKYRIENLLRARALYAKSVKLAPLKSMTFAMELANRKNEVEVAVEELGRLKQTIASMGAALMAAPSENSLYEFNELKKELKAQELRIRNKERAVTNWLTRGEKQSQAIVNREYKNKNIEKFASEYIEKEPDRNFIDIRLDERFHSKPTTEAIIPPQPGASFNDFFTSNEPLEQPKKRVQIDDI